MNNKGNAILEVQPTLYNKQGQELQLPPVTVEPQNFRFINLADWAAIGGESYKSGNIKLFHYGKDLVLGAQIYLTDETRSLSYEEKLTELGKFDSRRQEAVWWMPSNDTKVKIILTNTSDAPLDVTGRLAKKPNNVGNPQSVQLAAHQTKVFDLKDDFPNGNQFANAEIIALSLAHSGAKDALLARIFLAEPERGYSNVVQFSNPNGGKSAEYQGVGFQIEDIADQELKPVIVARNVGTAAATVTAKIPYTRANGTKGIISLPQEQLSGGEMRLLNTQKIIQRVRQENIKVASIEITYDTANGSVIVAAHSVSEDRNQVFRVPMWDPFGQRSPTGGYPWRIEGTSVTQNYIKNIADYEEDYVAFLVWENGGIYMLGVKPIAAHETVAIDIKRLRDEQIPDEQGRTIPLSVANGQLQWTLRRKDNQPDDDTRANLALIGRSEQVDTAKGITNNYACQNCCPGTHISGFIFPASQEIEYGESATFASVEVEETCYGFPYQFNIGANWTSSNSAMGAISGGSITPQSAGQSNIGASWRTNFAYSIPCPPGGGGGPQFLVYPDVTAQNCNDGNVKKGGPNSFETENELINSAMLAPPCGSCIYYGFTFAPPLAILDVKPKIKILRNGQDITSTPQNANVQNVTVGERIELNTQIIGGTPTSRQWAIPGIAIADYEVSYTDPESETSALVTDLSPEDFTQPSITYYWVDGGNARSVQYSTVINNKSYTVAAKFNVSKPTATLTTTTGSVGIGTVQVSEMPNDNVFALHFGKPFVSNQVGIRFNASVTLPSSVTGETIWVQVVNSTRKRTPNFGREQTKQGIGLDTEFPYDVPNQAITEDSPLEILDPECSYKTVSANDHYTMWLLFKPQTANAIYIPLKSVDWNWSGSGTRSTICGSWTLANPSNTINPIGENTTEHPQWTANITQFDWR